MRRWILRCEQIFDKHAPLVLRVSRRRAGSCLLCDVEYDEWFVHSKSTPHLARHAVCDALAAPDRHETIMKQLWEHIRIDFSQMDEVMAKKEARRRKRLTTTLQHLADQRILIESLPRPSEPSSSLTVSSRFNMLLAVGSTYADREVYDRVARLLPMTDGEALRAVTTYILSQRQLGRLFTLLSVGSILSNHSEFATALKNDERSAILLAMIGEMQMYSRRPRSRDVSKKPVADALVLNVLATHAMDNIISELTHTVLQQLVDEGTPVWKSYRKTLAQRSNEELNVVQESLSASPSGRFRPATDPGDETTERMTADLVQLSKLSEGSPDDNSTPRLLLSSLDLLRSSVVDAGPSNAARNATFAVTIPRLATKKRS